MAFLISSTNIPTLKARPQTKVLVVALLYLSVVLLSFLARLAPGTGILFSFLTLCLFAAPGFLIGLGLFGRGVLHNPESLIFGAIIGISMSGYAALAVGYMAHRWSVGLITCSLLGLIVVCGVLCWKASERPVLVNLRAWEVGDYANLVCMWAVLVSFVAIPFLNIGKLTRYGFAYAWLFGYDFLLRMSFVSTITLGLPPDFLEMSGNRLRLYLVSYAAPAFAYSASGKTVSVASILILFTLAYDFLFVAGLYALLRLFVARRMALVWTTAVAMLGYSYYWLYLVAKRILHQFLAAFSWSNATDALGFGDVAHLLQRFFLVEPQGIAGLCLLLLVVFILETTEYRVARYGLAVALGLAIGLLFGVEAWNGLVLAIWFGCVEVGRLLWGPRLEKKEFGPLLMTFGLCAVVYFSFFFIGVYSFSSGRLLSISPYWQALVLAPLYLPVEFGPLLVLGLWGFRLRWSRNPFRVSAPLTMLLAFGLLQMFLMSTPAARTLGILKGNRLLPIVFLLWTGYLFNELFLQEQSRRKRWAAIALVCAAFPTFVTDIYFTSETDSLNNTRYVRVADRKACEWIRNNVSARAIIQGEPEYVGYGRATSSAENRLSLIASFAERGQILGAESTVGTVENAAHIAKIRRADLQNMLMARDLDTLISVVTMYHIDFLYIGPYEQQLYPQLLALVRSAPESFREVYNHDEVHIFERELGKEKNLSAGDPNPSPPAEINVVAKNHYGLDHNAYSGSSSRRKMRSSHCC